MKFRLAWACGGFVALAILIRVTVEESSTETSRRPSSASESSARPSPGNLFGVRTQSGSISVPGSAQFKSASQPYPAREMSPLSPRSPNPEECAEGERILRAVKAGKDPITGLDRDPNVAPEALVSRFTQDQLAIRERMMKISSDQALVAQQQIEEARRKLIEAGINPDLPRPGRTAPPTIKPAISSTDADSGDSPK